MTIYYYETPVRFACQPLWPPSPPPTITGYHPPFLTQPSLLSSKNTVPADINVTILLCLYRFVYFYNEASETESKS